MLFRNLIDTGVGWRNEESHLYVCSALFLVTCDAFSKSTFLSESLQHCDKEFTDTNTLRRIV